VSKVVLTIVTTMSAVATGVTTAAFNATLVDSEGVSHSGSLSVSSLNDSGAGTLTFADDIPVGSFSGSVQTVDTTGAALGSPVSFSGSVSGGTTAPNMQPVVTSITVSVG